MMSALTCAKCGKQTLVTYNLTGFCTQCQREWDAMAVQPKDVVVITGAKLKALEEVARAVRRYVDTTRPFTLGEFTEALNQLQTALDALAKLEEKQS